MVDREFVDFIRAHRFGVVASLGGSGEPQAAWVGIAVTDDGDVLFDTSPASRKAHNLTRDGRFALVVTAGEVTLQCEGTAVVLEGEEHDRYLPSYVASFPGGRRRAADGAVLVRLTPSWARISDLTARSASVRVLAVGGPDQA